MTSLGRRLLAVALALVAPAGSARAAGPTYVHDEAKLFGPKAIDAANREIADIRQQYHRSVVVETVPALDLPEKKGWRFSLSAKQFYQKLDEEARARAEALGANGIFILISMSPKAVAVIAWPPVHERVCDSADRHKLRKLVERQLQSGDPDKALLAVVGEARTVLRDNLADKVPTETPDASLLLGLAAVLLVFWLIVWVIRRRMEAAPAQPPELVPAVLGSMFGTPAGVWIYDRLFLTYRPPPPAAVPDPEPPAPPPDQAAPQPEPSDPVETTT